MYNNYDVITCFLFVTENSAPIEAHEAGAIRHTEPDIEAPVKKKTNNPNGRKGGRKPAEHFYEGFSYKINSTDTQRNIK